MKKVLENELISLAHRILKMRGKAEVEQLKQEAGELYEKLTLLDFADRHFDGLQPTLNKEKFKQTIAQEFQVERDHERYPDGTEYNPEAISEPNTEKIKDIVSQMPPETEEVDGLMNGSNNKPKEETSKETQDIIGVSYDDLPDFEPADGQNKQQELPEEDESKKEKPVQQPEEKSTEKDNHNLRKNDSQANNHKKSLNNRLVRDLKLGLNNKIAFTKHLFDGDQSALQETINSINKCKSYREAQHYINQKVKPRYNKWKGKEDYEERFLALVENKFSE